MVESIIMLRSEGGGTDNDSYEPRQANLQPYIDISAANGYNFRYSDVTSRMGVDQATEPRLVVIRARMHNQAALSMQSDPKLWMIARKRLERDEDNQWVVVDTNYDDTYTAQERTIRINQLSNLTDFDYQQIDNWWTTDKTRREVGEKLRDYLRDINRPQ